MKSGEAPPSGPPGKQRNAPGFPQQDPPVQVQSGNPWKPQVQSNVSPYEAQEQAKDLALWNNPPKIGRASPFAQDRPKDASGAPVVGGPSPFSSDQNKQRQPVDIVPPPAPVAAQPAAAAGGPTFCGECGTQSKGGKFCEECGTAL